jgi:plastocyanin domain-containing protein
MVRAPFAVVLGLALGLSACKKETATPAKKAEPATMTTGTVTDGVRKIAIEAGKEGYVPAKIPGKPGEKLVLVFTRTVEGDCLSQLKTPDGKMVALPMNSPVEVPVTVPTDGEVKFACGMDMFSGVVVAQKS